MNELTAPLYDALRHQIASDPDLSQLDLLSLVRTSLRLSAQCVPYAQIGPGQSRIGGVPDVPSGFEWPRWLPEKPRDDKFAEPWRPSGPAPLAFIAQIDLSEIPRIDDLLPSTGWLFFFYDRYCELWGFDPADRGCCRVLFFDGDRSSLTRMEPPPDADPEHVAEPCVLEAWPELTLPEDMPELEDGTRAYDAYRSLCEGFSRAGGMAYHRLLGHPQLVQNPMELECQLASNGLYCGNAEGYLSEKAKSLEEGAADWLLLLQVDTDEDGPGWMWGDVGRIYYWIKRQDLQARRFNDAWLILQCG